MTNNVEEYFTDGCGRCPLGGTPDCKVNNWQAELRLLREIVLECGLTEESKWGMPCYTYNSKNVLIVSAFKEFSAINFFKGSLLSDPHKLLVLPGENSQAARFVKFTHPSQIEKNRDILKAYIFEAIEVEKSGLQVKFKSVSDYEVPEELEIKMNEIPALRTAFEALTPGRQKGYIIYFSQPKQSQTRFNRIDKSMEKIMKGLGWNDR